MSRPSFLHAGSDIIETAFFSRFGSPMHKPPPGPDHAHGRIGVPCTVNMRTHTYTHRDEQPAATTEIASKQRARLASIGRRSGSLRDATAVGRRSPVKTNSTGGGRGCFGETAAWAITQRWRGDKCDENRTVDSVPRELKYIVSQKQTMTLTAQVRVSVAGVSNATSLGQTSKVKSTLAMICRPSWLPLSGPGDVMLARLKPSSKGRSAHANLYTHSNSPRLRH